MLERRKFLLILFITGLSIGWCEFGYYYFTFYFICSGWPVVSNQENGYQNLTNIYILADTHIMGPRVSNRLDKIRREWEMKQAFKISTNIYKPDLIVFMGDIFDEGYFSTNEIFEQSVKDFEEIFAQFIGARDNIMIAGNHDVGYHNRVLDFPFILDRFSNQFRTTNDVDLISYRRKSLNASESINIIVSNSMSFYNDSCPFCMRSIAKMNQISTHLDSPPILLTHIPLYRLNDSQCEHPESLNDFVQIENLEGHDVLHKRASQHILERLRPMLIISGHTHLKCITQHDVASLSKNFEEITVSSYNHKYAEGEPGFLLLSANSTHYFTTHCNQVKEIIMELVYGVSLLMIFAILLWPTGKRLSRSGSKNALVTEIDENGLRN